MRRLSALADQTGDVLIRAASVPNAVGFCGFVRFAVAALRSADLPSPNRASPARLSGQARVSSLDTVGVHSAQTMECVSDTE
jgi:hypothetical protein